MDKIIALFNLDTLGLLMLTLVILIGICVGSFAKRYLQGDSLYRSFYIYLGLLILFVGLMITSDHLLLFFIAWTCANTLLIRLMIYKSKWKAAKASGLLTTQYFFWVTFLLAVAFFGLYMVTGETSIQTIINQTQPSAMMLPILLLLLFAAMIQSAIWPFHGWLLSSLNSPTPVSAMMHAGLINGGGFLLVRFAPLYLSQPELLNIIFILGIATALLATLWKLLQTDIKRMLACSTMSQMGFMFAQCGLGLFPLAVMHIICHGLFKAYLFLASPSAAQEKRLHLDYPPTIICLISALLCGLIAASVFMITSGKTLGYNTYWVLFTITFIAGSQFALTLLKKINFTKWIVAIIVTSIIAMIYGYNVALISKILAPMQLMQAQTLNLIHIVAIIVLILSFLALILIRFNNGRIPHWAAKTYVIAINASQPHPNTVTTHRNDYQYK